MSKDAPVPTAPRVTARNLKYALLVLALTGWLVSAFQAIQRGEPIPPPPIVLKSAEPAPAADNDEPPAVRHTYGWKRPAADEVPERVFSAPPGQELPAAVQLLAAQPVEVPAPLPFDQGQIGSCGPNSAVADLLYAEARAGKKGLPPPSRLFVYYTTRQVMGTTGQDSGVSNAAMFRALAQYGICDEGLWPYSDDDRFRQKPPAAAYAQAAQRKVTDAEAVPQNLTAMKACLASGKPIVFGFTVYPSFESRAVELTGLVPMPSKRDLARGPLGGHDVLLDGYDDKKKCFTFLNSWGPDWGRSGFGMIPYSYATNPQLAGDFWTLGASPR